jgi:hypothetical protein
MCTLYIYTVFCLGHVMEPCWEWKWAAWDEAKKCFVQTPIWMTDAEACADWWAYTDQRSHKIEHTKRDRNSAPSIAAIDPPAGEIDWKREARQRAERSRYGLPPFVTPSYEELRRTWKENPACRRIALEVQTDRYTFAELEAMAAEEYWHLTKESATVDDGRKALARLRRRLMAELNRIGTIDSKRRR